MRTIRTQEIIRLVKKIAEDKKGNDVIVLDLKKSTIICDYFIIISATSKIHAKAICEAIEEALKKNKITTFSKQGKTEASWILLDIGNIIVHIFTEDKREFYDLEGLWEEWAT